MKIWKTQIIGLNEQTMFHTITPGTICTITDEELIVATGGGLVKILEIQFDSCRKMRICECGHNMDEGELLG